MQSMTLFRKSRVRFILFIGFLLFCAGTLSSCSMVGMEESSQSGTPPSNWSLNPPQLITKNEHGGLVATDLSRSELGQLTLDLPAHRKQSVAHDGHLIDALYPHLVFSKADENIPLSVATECQLGENGPTLNHSQTLVTRKQTPLLAALPLTVFRPMPVEARWNCDLRFEAVHQSGVRHAFEIKGFRFWSWSTTERELSFDKAASSPTVHRLVDPGTATDPTSIEQLSLVCPSWWAQESLEGVRSQARKSSSGSAGMDPTQNAAQIASARHHRIHALSRVDHVQGDDTRKTERRPLCAVLSDQLHSTATSPSQPSVISRSLLGFVRLTFAAPALNFSVRSEFRLDVNSLQPAGTPRPFVAYTVSNPNPFAVTLAHPFGDSLTYRPFSVMDEAIPQTPSEHPKGLFRACRFQTSVAISSQNGAVTSFGSNLIQLGPGASVQLTATYFRPGISISFIHFDRPNPPVSMQFSTHFGLSWASGSRHFRTLSGSDRVGWKKMSDGTLQQSPSDLLIDAEFDGSPAHEIPEHFVFNSAQTSGPLPFSADRAEDLQKLGQATSSWSTCWKGQIQLFNPGIEVRD